MGLSPFSKSFYDSGPTQSGPTQSPNPNPRNFIVQNSQQVGKHVVVAVKYPDATNYEGNKILIFKNCDVSTLIEQRVIDPHFSENRKFHSPFARFEPTEEGWDAAVLFLETYKS